MKPSDFIVTPSPSILHNLQSEIIAKNVMFILSKGKNIFRDLTWEEYKVECSKRGDIIMESAFPHFQNVIKYCKSPITVVLFSSVWMDVYQKELKKQKQKVLTIPPIDIFLSNVDKYRKSTPNSIQTSHDIDFDLFQSKLSNIKAKYPIFDAEFSENNKVTIYIPQDQQ